MVDLCFNSGVYLVLEAREIDRSANNAGSFRFVGFGTISVALLYSLSAPLPDRAGSRVLVASLSDLFLFKALHLYSRVCEIRAAFTRAVYRACMHVRIESGVEMLF